MELAAVFQRGASVLHSPSSRWLHPLSSSLPVFLSGFQPYIRGETADSHPRGAGMTPRRSPPPPFISSDFSLVLAGGPSASFSRRSLSSCRWDRKNSTGLTEDNIPGKRAEGVIIPTKHPPRLAQSLLSALEIPQQYFPPVCWRRFEFAEFLGLLLHHREPVVRVCARAFASLALR